VFFLFFFAICRQRTTPTNGSHDMHMINPLPSLSHVLLSMHIHSRTHTHTQSSHPLTHIHRLLHSHPNCSSVLLNVWQSAKAVESHSHTYIHTHTAVAESEREWVTMRESPPTWRTNYFTQLSLLIFCVFILNFCGSMCLANPKSCQMPNSPHTLKC